jgi:hypothetical protein
MKSTKAKTLDDLEALSDLPVEACLGCHALKLITHFFDGTLCYDCRLERGLVCPGDEGPEEFQPEPPVKFSVV